PARGDRREQRERVTERWCEVNARRVDREDGPARPPWLSLHVGGLAGMSGAEMMRTCAGEIWRWMPRKLISRFTRLSSWIPRSKKAMQSSLLTICAASLSFSLTSLAGVVDTTKTLYCRRSP